MVGKKHKTTCASCRHMRRKCSKECPLAPYFSSADVDLDTFANIRSIFTTGNVIKMLQNLPVHQRGDAARSLQYEANAQMRDPVYGCAGEVSHLRNQVLQLQMELAVAQAQIQSPPPPPPPICMQVQPPPPTNDDNDDEIDSIDDIDALIDSFFSDDPSTST